MNSRERFMATISFDKIDRFFRRDMGFWPSTIERWKREGLPPNWNETNFFGYDKEYSLPIDLGWCDSPFCPPFKEVVLEEDATTRTIQDRNGGIRIELKGQPDTSMPRWIKRPVENRKDWEALRWRLRPDSKDRLKNLDSIPKDIKKSKDRDFPVEQGVVGGFMHLRNLFGLEKLCLIMFRDPELIDEIIENWLELNEYISARILGVTDLDILFFAEDICYRHGPLISPKMYQRFLSPYYKKLVRFLKSYGDIKTIYDSDGQVDQLIPLLIEWGCDALLPIEVQAGNDVVKLRKIYGEKIALMGRIDKRVLAQDYKAIEEEIAQRISFFLGKSGYVPMIDHTVPCNVPFDNYMHYLKILRSYSPACSTE